MEIGSRIFCVRRDIRSQMELTELPELVHRNIYDSMDYINWQFLSTCKVIYDTYKKFMTIEHIFFKPIGGKTITKFNTCVWAKFEELTWWYIKDQVPKWRGDVGTPNYFNYFRFHSNGISILPTDTVLAFSKKCKRRWKELNHMTVYAVGNSGWRSMPVVKKMKISDSGSLEEPLTHYFSLDHTII